MKCVLARAKSRSNFFFFFNCGVDELPVELVGFSGASPLEVLADPLAGWPQSGRGPWMMDVGLGIDHYRLSFE
jgi:hypothetical protein